jgi:uncharacterized membrane protein (UPF0127 family)
MDPLVHSIFGRILLHSGARREARMWTIMQRGRLATALLFAPGRKTVAVNVELAATPDAIGRGLSTRQGLGEFEGMLFVFDGPPGRRSFNMRSMSFPLDLVGISSEQVVESVIANATPGTEGLEFASSQFVLEVPAGFATRWGIVAGTQVEFF